jgi:hypothetical protein
LAIVLALGGFWMVNGWSGNASPRVAAARDSFAADRDTPPERIDFDAARALGYLKDLCRIGPRISGSEGMKRQQELLRKHFTELGGQVRLQPFTARQRSRKEPTPMANLIVAWHPERPRRVILCAHYDTRPIADNERDPRKWHEPFLSANDGGSGVALLMELAHHVKELKTDVGVDFVFFDGEEYIFDRDGDKYFFGSDYFAQEYRRTQPKQRYVKAILLDMIGGKDARFPGEQNSLLSAAPLVQEVWRIAAEQKCTVFRNDVGPAVLDDHLALNKVGIPAIDIVDLDYPHWHKLSDLPENCSEESLTQVARVLIVWLQRVK